MIPSLENISTFKSMWALCTVNKEGRMKATHYASCLVSGRSPLWGLWTINGKWVRFYGGREAILRSYPDRTWRRVMARWKLQDDADSDAKSRRVVLSIEMKSPLPESDEPASSNVIKLRNIS